MFGLRRLVIIVERTGPRTVSGLRFYEVRSVLSERTSLPGEGKWLRPASGCCAPRPLPVTDVSTVTATGDQTEENRGSPYGSCSSALLKAFRRHQEEWPVLRGRKPRSSAPAEVSMICWAGFRQIGGDALDQLPQIYSGNRCTRSDRYPCHLGIAAGDFVTGWKLHEPRGTPSLMLAHPKRLVSSLLCWGVKGRK
jgi:hypothetical protein